VQNQWKIIMSDLISSMNHIDLPFSNHSKAGPFSRNLHIFKFTTGRPLQCEDFFYVFILILLCIFIFAIGDHCSF